jgi:hypothetical protein
MIHVYLDDDTVSSCNVQLVLVLDLLFFEGDTSTVFLRFFNSNLNEVHYD